MLDLTLVNKDIINILFFNQFTDIIFDLSTFNANRY